ncbi:MAG: glycosyltransferase family 4 protein [Methylacidiphilales bacterium]|nr:glycosyltransferase family 4 protein [Candidatus Methylacidiphilales bacterium]MDW8349508.1 glycosyltransferase family 4 protein [Verrucomicrobiae bacterium]
MSNSIVFARRNFSPTGGAELYLTHLAERLNKCGFSLELLCETWNEKAKGPFEKITAIASKSPRQFAEALQQWKRRHPQKFLFSLERVYEADLYRAGDGLHAAWLRRRVQYSPIVGRIHNWLKLKNWEMLGLEKRMIEGQGLRRVIVNSRMVRDEFLAAGYPIERMTLIYNGVDFKRFASGSRDMARERLGLSANQLVALFVGVGRERKGYYYAKEAVKQAGGYKFLAIEKPPPISMPDVYAAADVFIFPTLYDPCANATLEAWAAGLPVVTTKSNGASERMQHGREGFILERSDDINGMVTALDQLRDPAKRAIMGKAAQDLARQHDLTAHVEAVVQCIQAAKSC